MKVNTYYGVMLGWGYAIWTFKNDAMVDDYSDGDSRCVGQVYATGEWTEEDLLSTAESEAAERHAKYGGTGMPERSDWRLLNRGERIRLTTKHAGRVYADPTDHRVPPLEPGFGVALF